MSDIGMEIRLALEQALDVPTVTEHQTVEFSCPAPPGAQLTLTVDGQPLEPFLRPGNDSWRWQWNAGTAVGLRRLTLTAIADEAPVESRVLALRVAPRKIDQDHYELLIQDLQRTVYSLVYGLSGASSEGADLQPEAPWQRDALEEYYALFEERLNRFARAVRRIDARPRSQLRSVDEQVLLGQADGLSDDALAHLTRGPFDAAPPDVAPELQAALRPEGGLLPRQVAATRSVPTLDTYEHRLLKHLLTLLLRRARSIAVLAEREIARLNGLESATGSGLGRRLRAEQIADGCSAAVRLLREMRALPLLAEVGPLPAFRGPTALLQREPAYRDIYRMWQALRQHAYLSFDSPLFTIPIGDMPRLYESWCVLQVVQAVLAWGGTIREQRLVERRPPKTEEDELQFIVELAEQRPLLVIEHPTRTLTLRYQPHYRPLARAGRVRLGSLDRHTRVPDLAIEFQRDGAAPEVLILDAKYRLDAEGRSVPQDALADAYAYLGAIGYHGARATIGAILLYPGMGTVERYPSGVAALPLLPGRTEQLQAILATFASG